MARVRAGGTLELDGAYVDVPPGIGYATPPPIDPEPET